MDSQVCLVLHVANLVGKCPHFRGVLIYRGVPCNYQFSGEVISHYIYYEKFQY